MKMSDSSIALEDLDRQHQFLATLNSEAAVKAAQALVKIGLQ